MALSQLAPNTIIVTHINADFDAIASTLAAKKLYPEAVIILPESQSKAPKDFILQSTTYLLNPKKFKEIDIKNIKRIIIVDTSNKKRINKDIRYLLEKKDIEVIVYDHHASKDNDIKADKFYYKPTGSNVTIMIEELRKTNIKLTPDEATLLALGIYEDTGFFTYISTTAEDLRQAAWLIEQGADLKTISEVLSDKSRITPEHIQLLNKLLSNSNTITIGNIKILISKANLKEYVPDIAILAKHLMELFKVDVVFILIMLVNKVIIIGRSKDDRIHIGNILTELGGGGHKSAAFVTLKDIPIAEVELKLVAILEKQLKVKNYMSSPVISLNEDVTINQAHNLFIETGFKVLPIVDHNDKPKGYITIDIIEKAMQFGLNNEIVKEHMIDTIKSVTPNDSLDKVIDIIINKKQPLLPVVSNKRLVGVLTKTDIINILTENIIPDSLEHTMHKKNLKKLLNERLDKRFIELFKIAGEVAKSLGFKVFIVGGFVRDLLLRYQNLDIDLVIEGDGIKFAEEFAKKVGARVKAHEKFNTAILIFPDGLRIDVATARHEYYKSPGDLPRVMNAPLRRDLYRRDFTINTLAISINPENFGELIDHFGGQRDIKDKVIRVLHNLSFIEDPTRILRAVRFEQRYNFRIGKQTLKLLKRAIDLKVISKASKSRILLEFIHILEEPSPIKAIKRLDELGVLREIHPAIRLEEKNLTLLLEAEKVLNWYNEFLFKKEKPLNWIVYFLALTDLLGDTELYLLAEELEVTGTIRTIFTHERERAIKILSYLKNKPLITRAEIYWLLKGQKLECILYILAKARRDNLKHVKKYIIEYITELSETKPFVTGEDIKALGFKPGPIFKKILNRVLEARLNKEIQNKEEALKLIKREFLLNSNSF